MRYSILGTTQVHRSDGTALALGGPRLRALLAALALRPGRALTTGELIADVWGADPPADAAGALQALVGRLRRAIGRDTVASVHGGYRLRAEPDAVDLYRFEQLAAEGARALADADPAKAAGVLDDALALWRGPALADLPDCPAESARAESRHLAARRDRLAADLALGRAEHALPALTALCEAHPLDEPLQALRLRALRAAGRTAEALAAYESVRTGIADRLGADPGPELRSLHAELLRPAPFPPHRPHCPQPPAAADPDAAAYGDTAVQGSAPAHGDASLYGDAPGRGGAPAVTGVPAHGDNSARGNADARGDAGARDGAIANADSPRPAPARPDGGVAGGEVSGGLSRSGGSRPGAGVGGAWGGRVSAGGRRGNLRARLTSFVGREGELAGIRADMAAYRLVTLLGPGGAGKTRLSQEGAESAAVADPAAWPQGVWFAELAPVDADDPQAVAEAVLTALGARETVVIGTAAEGLRAAGDPTALDSLARLAEHCAGRRMLLVLDNCEHVIGAAAHVADRLLADCPGVTVLATSREPLAVPGEVVRPVEPLPDPVALRLLADRGAAARAGFRIEDDPAACAEICRRLDGLPLAIELAAARLRLLSPRQIADRLDDRFRLLTSGSRTVLPRQQTLRAVVDWSWDLLDACERAVLRRLSVFAGGCDLTAAEEVCADEPTAPTTPVTPHDIAPLLGSLVDKSLVVAAPAEAGDGMRYRLLETVAEYAGERLDEAGERGGVERRHLVAYRELVRRAEPSLRGAEQRAWLDRMELEHDNLRTALRRALAARDEHEALCLVLCLQWFWQLRGHRGDARMWSAAAAALGPNPFAAPVVPAPPLHLGPIDAPPPMAPEQLLEARRQVRLVSITAMESDMAAMQSPEMRSQLDGIVAAYRPGLPQICRVPGNLWYFAVLLNGEFEQLSDLLDTGVRSCRELGYDWELAYFLQTRAKLFSDQAGGLERAKRDADESLEIFVRLGDAWGIAEALAGRGESREARGDYAAAAQDFREAARYVRQIGALSHLPLIKGRLAGVLMEMGQEERAERMLHEVIADEEHGAGDATPFARLQLGARLLMTGRTDEARTQLAFLEEVMPRFPDVLKGVVEGMRGSLEVREGRPADALPRIRRALSLMGDSLTRIVAPDVPVVQLVIGAEALALLGRPEAARVLGAYDALRSPSHLPPRVERVTRTTAEAAARAALGEERYEREYAEGGGLRLEEAAALI